MRLSALLSLVFVLVWEAQIQNAFEIEDPSPIPNPQPSTQGLPIDTSHHCPTYWVDATEFDMGCLWFNFKTYMYWPKAQDFCRTLNTTTLKEAHLVEIYSLEQQNFLEFKFVEFDLIYGLYKNWWTGLTDDMFEGRWIWSYSLNQANFTNWYTSRPTQDANNNYVGIYYDAKYEFTWMDISGGNNFYPICQFFPDPGLIKQTLK